MAASKRREGPRLWAVALGLAVFRGLAALSLRTYFNPDEYWQGPEVAHKLVFGTGLLTWEWLPGAQIRSYLHPLLFAGLYQLLKLLGLDSRAAVAYGPAALQGVLSGLTTDFYVLRLGQRYLDDSSATGTASPLSLPLLALCLQLTNWFNWYALGRTFSSSLEANLLLPALHHWLSLAERLEKTDSKRNGSSNSSLPSRAASWEERLALALGALGVLVRPTAVFAWLPLGLWRLARTGARERTMIRRLGCVVAYLASEVLPWVGGVFLLAGVLLDSRCYGEWVVAPWNFLRFNLLEGKARLYGTHPAHWYFTQGLPAVLTSQLPLFLLGLRRALASSSTSTSHNWTALRLVALVAVCYPLGLSLSAHKEFRFLLPVLPLASLLGACGAVDLLAWWSSSNKIRGSEAQPPATRRVTRGSVARDQQRQEKTSSSSRTPASLLAGFLLLTQLPMAWYFSRVHQSGPVAAMDYLAARLSAAAAAPSEEAAAVVIGIDFLMPCHATPWTAHLHVPGVYPRLTLRHLGCPPEERAAGSSETDRFLANPLAYARGLYDGRPQEAMPRFVVAFSSAAGVMASYLEEVGDVGYGRAASFFYSAFKGDADSAAREDSIVVFERRQRQRQRQGGIKDVN